MSVQQAIARHYRRHPIERRDNMTFPYGKLDLLKIARGLGIALAGAALTYLLQVVSHTSFGMYTPLVMAVASTVVNGAIKALDGVKE